MFLQKIKAILPSKKVLVGIFSVCIIGVGAYFFSRIPFHHKAVKDTASLADIPAVPEAVLKQTFETDTDGDGVPDWEEALWGTDPKRKDTDGDGVPDGQFIAEQKAKLQATAPASANQPQSESDTFQRQLYSTIAYLNQSGQLTPDREQELSDIFTTYVTQTPEVGLTRADLKIVGDDAASVSAYMIRINDFFKNNEIIPSHMADLLQAARFGSVSNELYQSIALPYGRSIDAFKTIPVPDKFADSHLALLNAMAVFKVGVIDGLSHVSDDPIAAFRAVAAFKDSSQAVVDATDAFQNSLTVVQ